MKKEFTFTETEKKRIDKYLFNILNNISVVQIQKFIRKNKVRVNQKRCKDIKYMLHTGDVIELYVSTQEIQHEQEKRNTKPQAKTIHFAVLHEDDAIMVIDKPAGLAVEETENEREITLEDELQLYFKNWTNDFFPRHVHRIDRDTAGCLIIVKTKDAYDHLLGQFKKRTVSKTYYALCHGVFENQKGTIDFSLKKIGSGRKKVVISHEGKESITHYKVLQSYNSVSWLEISIETGRTHQIRVHMSEIGHPICFDDVYGDREADKILRDKVAYKKQYLFAKEIQFVHPITSNHIRCTSKVPFEAEKSLKQL